MQIVQVGHLIVAADLANFHTSRSNKNIDKIPNFLKLHVYIRLVAFSLYAIFGGDLSFLI